MKRGHKCIESNLKSECPICFDEIFSSVEPSVQLQCGHIMHKQCLDDYLYTNYVCPLCNKSIYWPKEYFKKIDEYITTEEKLPPEFSEMKNEVYCNDCEKRSIVPFHFVYHKCKYCHGFNTRIIRTISRQNSRNIDN